MNKCKVLALTLLSAMLVSGVATAKIEKLEVYRGGQDRWGFYYHDKDITPPSPTTSCASYGGTYIKPVNKTCSIVKIDNRNCYYNCYCPATYSLTCTYPQMGTDAGCNGKYIACECASEYSLSCIGVGEVGTDEGCDGKYKACKCGDDYKYTAENCNGTSQVGGSPCHEIYYPECNSTQSGDDEDPIGLVLCNQFTDFKGSLFDGEIISTSIKSSGSESKNYAIYKDIMGYHPSHAVDKSDAVFGAGHWYLPSVGEALEILGYDWRKLTDEMKDNIRTEEEKIEYNKKFFYRVDQALSENSRAPMDYPNLFGLMGDYGEELKQEHLYKLLETQTQLLDMGMGVFDIQEAFEGPGIWTSNPAGEKYAYAVSKDEGIVLAERKEEAHFMPVIMLSIATDTPPEIGEVLTKDKEHGEAQNFNINSIVGIIYKVTKVEEGRYRVRAISVDLYGLVSWNKEEEGSFDDVLDVHDNPFLCMSWPKEECGEEFIYDDSNCLKGLGGEFCGGKYTQCEKIKQCYVNDYKEFTGPAFDGYGNTQLMHNNSAEAAKVIEDFYPYWLVLDDDERFGKGKWYLPSLGEDFALHKCDVEAAARFFSGEEIIDETLLDQYYTSYCRPAAEEYNDFYDNVWRPLCETLGGEYCGEETDYYWLSQELDATQAIAHRTVGDHLYINKKDETLNALPVVMVEGDYNGAEYGDLLLADGSYGKRDEVDEGQAVGVIFWVAPDGSRVRAASAVMTVGNDEAWVLQQPWQSGPEDIEAMPNNPFYCADGSVCTIVNDYVNLTGPLFDGKGNTRLMLVTGDDTVKNAATEVSHFYPGDLVDSADEKFGEGKWYVPSLGEGLAIISCDLAAISGFVADQGSEFYDKYMEGADFNSTLEPYCDLDKYGEFLNTMKDVFENRTGLEWNINRWPSWLSQEYGEDAFVLKISQEPNEIKIDGKDGENSVLPAVMVEGDYNGAEYGDVLLADGTFGKYGEVDDGQAVGVIYWVAPDGSKVRAVHYHTILENGGDMGAFDFLYNEGTMVTWNGKLENIEVMPDYPFGCEGGSGSGSGGGSLPQCSVVWQAAFERFTDYNNTTILNNVDAIEYVANYVPSGVISNDTYFGKGKWYLPPIGEWMYIDGVDFNTAANMDTAVGSGNHIEGVNNALTKLKAKGVDADNIATSAYWSVNPHESMWAWYYNFYSRRAYNNNRVIDTFRIRPFARINALNLLAPCGGINNVVYSNRTCGTADDYNGSKTPIGIMSKSLGDSVIVIALKESTGRWGNHGSFNGLPRNTGGIDNHAGCEGNIGFPTQTCGEEYQYDETNCSAPKQLSGLVCGGKYTKCLEHCTVVYEPAFERFTDYSNTSVVNYVKAINVVASYVPEGVAPDDPNFGEGQWYLPPIGELITIDNYWGSQFSAAGKLSTISPSGGSTNYMNDTVFAQLRDNGVDVDDLSGIVWSSSEFNANRAWYYSFYTHHAINNGKGSTVSVRPVLRVKKDDVENIGQCSHGSIIFADMTCGMISDYDGSRTPVGVIYGGGGNGSSYAIVGLKKIGDYVWSEYSNNVSAITDVPDIDNTAGCYGTPAFAE